MSEFRPHSQELHCWVTLWINVWLYSYGNRSYRPSWTSFEALTNSKALQKKKNGRTKNRAKNGTAGMMISSRCCVRQTCLRKAIWHPVRSVEVVARRFGPRYCPFDYEQPCANITLSEPSLPFLLSDNGCVRPHTTFGGTADWRNLGSACFS